MFNCMFGIFFSIYSFAPPDPYKSCYFYNFPEERGGPKCTPELLTDVDRRYIDVGHLYHIFFLYAFILCMVFFSYSAFGVMYMITTKKLVRAATHCAML